MSNPSRFILAGLLALSVSPALSVPVLPDVELHAYATDGLVTVSQSSLLPVGGSGVASVSQGSVSSGIQGAAIATGNGFNLDFTFTERLGAPHPIVTYYDSLNGVSTYLSVGMQAISMLSGTFTLDAADVGYTYAFAAEFDQAGTSQMFLHTYLYDLMAFDPSYHLFQQNSVSTDAGMGSDIGAQSSVYSQAGSTSGGLLAGHSYGYAITSLIGHNESADGETATEAHGTFKLAIQGPAPEAVPEPSGLALCGLGLGGLLWGARKRSASRS